MDMDEYQRRAKLTAVYPREHALAYVTLGLLSEAGEVAAVQKRFLRDSLSEEEAAKATASELGDCLWYIAMIAKEMGVHLSDIANDNLAKLADRKDRGTLRGSGDAR